MLGNFIPASVWESAPLRAARGPVARGIGKIQSERSSRRRWARRRGEALAVLQHFEGELEHGQWWFVRTVKSANTARTASWMAVHESLLGRTSHQPFLPDARVSVDAIIGRQARLAVVKGRSKGSFRGRVALLRHSRVALVFDPQLKQVARWSSDGFSQDYFAMRDMIAKFVPSVPYETFDDRSRIYEPIVEGTALINLSAAEVGVALELLLGRLADLATQTDANGVGRRWLMDALTTRASAVRPSSSSQRLLDWLGPSPLVPTHGDLSTENVWMVRAGPYLIDFGNVAMRPAWTEGVSAVYGAVVVHPELARSLEGPLGEYLDRVVPNTRPPDWVEILLAAAPRTHGYQRGDMACLNNAFRRA